jgi:hypothetical protein
MNRTLLTIAALLFTSACGVDMGPDTWEDPTTRPEYDVSYSSARTISVECGTTLSITFDDPDDVPDTFRLTAYGPTLMAAKVKVAEGSVYVAAIQSYACGTCDADDAACRQTEEAIELGGTDFDGTCKAQTDEKTGVRGYTCTGRPVIDADDPPVFIGGCAACPDGDCEDLRAGTEGAKGGR